MDERQIRAAIEALQALLPDPQSAEEPDRQLSLGQAAHEIGCSEITMRRQAQRHGLGKKVFGRWKFSRRELREFRRRAG